MLACLDLDPSTLPEERCEEYLALRSDAEALARRFGRSWQTGSDGTVLVPLPRRPVVQILARSGPRYGELHFIPDRAGWRSGGSGCAACRRAALSDGLLRLSVGVEGVEDFLEDLARAMEA